MNEPNIFLVPRRVLADFGSSTRLTERKEFPRSFAPMLDLPMLHCASHSSASSFCFFPTHWDAWVRDTKHCWNINYSANGEKCRESQNHVSYRPVFYSFTHRHMASLVSFVTTQSKSPHNSRSRFSSKHLSTTQVLFPAYRNPLRHLEKQNTQWMLINRYQL